MKKNWKPVNIYPLLATIFFIGLGVSVILLFLEPTQKMVSAIIFFVTFAVYLIGLIACFILRIIFYKKYLGKYKKVSRFEKEIFVWLNYKLKKFSMDVVAINLNMYSKNGRSLFINFIATKSFDENSSAWLNDIAYSSSTFKLDPISYFGAESEQMQELVHAIKLYIKHGIYASIFKKCEAITCSNKSGELYVIYRNSENYLAKFKPLSQKAAILRATEDQCFSRLGGIPLLPKGFLWPSVKKKPLQLLAQLKFSEINSTGAMKNFPQKGLLYFFVDEEAINMICEEESECFEVVFCEEEADVVLCKKPKEVDVFGGSYVTVNIIDTYPDYSDCKEAKALLDEAPISDFISDYKYNLRYEHDDEYQVGGWPHWVQHSELDAMDGFVLLAQFGSDDENGRMWGDWGNLYFLIKEKDLLNRNFRQVKLVMQCT